MIFLNHGHTTDLGSYEDDNHGHTMDLGSYADDSFFSSSPYLHSISSNEKNPNIFSSQRPIDLTCTTTSCNSSFRQFSHLCYTTAQASDAESDREMREIQENRKPLVLLCPTLHKKIKKSFEIAIIGGGGAGSIIASLLSNLSDEDEDVIFNITILERSPHIINGSTFETAAVLYGDGLEYAKDAKTAAHCQRTGRLFKAMLPRLYTTDTQPIVFAIDPQSDLTPEIQEETRQRAKEITSTLDLASASFRK